MAIFKDETNSTSERKTLIGQSVRVEGNFSGEGDITVEGVVEGSIKTEHNLSVGPKAKIKAEIEAKNLYLSGTIRGNVKIREKTVLTQSAKILGNLETKILSVEEGAVINGKCIMGQDIQESGHKPEHKKTIK